MLDLRYLAVILAIIIGGPIASSITVTIILITRLFLTEYSLASELACYTIVLIGVGIIFYLADESFYIYKVDLV